MKKRKKISLILTACTAFVLAAEGSALADDTETISKNVYIGGVNVSGMTEEQATKAVEEKLGKGTGGNYTVKLGDEGFYNLIIGAADMGTGCDTILAQMAAECLNCSVDDIEVYGADTDSSPYDSGSYASSTTYITGKAVEMACEELKGNLCKIAAGMLECEESEVEFTGEGVRKLDGSGFVSRFDIATKSMANNEIAAQTTATHSSPVSPPPYMVGMVEIELDKETGKVDVLDYVAVVDCGTPINPNLARIQTEG